MSVHMKLAKARVDMQSKTLKKSGLNKFAGYQYFELGDFLPTINSVFLDNGLCGVVSYGLELATLTITADDGTSLTLTTPMSECEMKGLHAVQRLGAVQTYLRRYLWMTAMEIVEHDALDSSAGADKPTAKAEPKKYAGGVIKGTDGAMERLTVAEQEYIAELAADVLEAFQRSPANAWDRIDNQGLEQEQKIALWTLLPSNVRSALKRETEARKVTA